MNFKNWQKYKVLGLVDWSFYNSVRSKMLSHEYEGLDGADIDLSATDIHHLRDTEEQRRYNDEHYELWGHNLDGTFEYGKYVVFWTHEHHIKYHALSDETRAKISAANKGENNGMFGKHPSKESREKMSIAQKKYHRAHPFTDEQREHFREINSGENNPMFGKRQSEESNKKRSESLKGRQFTEEHRRKIAESNTGKKRTDEQRKKISEATREAMTDETRKKLSESHKGKVASDEARSKMSKSSIKRMRIITFEYKKYKATGGQLSWNDFQKYFKPTLDDIQPNTDETC